MSVTHFKEKHEYDLGQKFLYTRVSTFEIVYEQVLKSFIPKTSNLNRKKSRQLVYRL